METVAEWLRLDQGSIVQVLTGGAAKKLDGAGGEVVLDFSSVRRVDPGAIWALHEFSDRADEKGIKVVLYDVNIDIYKVLKLVKLASRFSFVTSPAQPPADK